jgi:GDP/UDP-N,N'-diacetylbacillosamine 2-epimerase (hydrolysing)
MKKKILILTSTRADYGLMKKLIFLLNKEKSFLIKLLVTGTHFDKKFGNTYKEIIKDKVNIDYKINLSINGDSAWHISNYFSKQAEKLNFIFKNKFKPDLIILLGDRFEILSVACICKIYNIPICHLHGGETTKGSNDEEIRHAISKLSSLHFVSHNDYKKKLVKMGENPNYIFNFGALGLNSINKFKLNKKEIENILNLSLDKKTFVVTFHPETLNKTTNTTMQKLLMVLKKFKKTNFIFTCPNMDVDHQKIILKIKKFVKENKNSFYFKSLGKNLYFSLLRYADGVIGNSSSGIIEVPSFNIPTINIGDRQKGRLQSRTIFNSDKNLKNIYNLILKIIKKKPRFIGNNNIYFKKFTEEKIINIIKIANLNNINKY